MTNAPMKDRNLMGLVNFGFFLVAVGIMFATTPGLYQYFLDFINSFYWVQFSPGLWFPVPSGSYPQVYGAFYTFCLWFGIFHIPVLVGRIFLKDPLRRETSTLGSIIFWLGTAYITTLLLAETVVWTTFVGYIIVLGGGCLVLEGLILLILRK